MAAADVHWLNGENIVVEVYSADYNARVDVAESAKRTTATLDGAAVPVPYIVDLRAINVDFGEMTTALAELTRDPNAAYRHPNLKELLVVSQNPLIKIGANALKHDQYGGVKTRIFATMDDALTYARSIAPTTAQA